ncbi:MAG: glycosyltransferase family 4 protein, partial [Candidatus Taylorbacteria bacterium]|nr:glycosyltransferase family 4 protein [Candidatus Taylorbacteria bacterium]
SGLKKNGVEIIECRDDARGLMKFWRLWKKHRAIEKDGGYDYLIVGYPGHITVTLARFISKKPVIFDALCTLYEGEVISRGRYRFNFLMKGWICLIDYLAAKSADLILVETNKQKDYFIERFGLKTDKVVRVFTGVDEEAFHPDPNVSKRTRFTVVFRGKFLPEAGVKYIIQAAEILKDEDIDFLIIGNGYLEDEIQVQLKETKARNIEWIRENLPLERLRNLMLECHASLGQFEIHDRLNRTIPHKAFESLAMGLPYITGRAEGIQELLTDGKDCLMTNLADADDLAAKILLLKNDLELRRNIAGNGRRLYEERLTDYGLGREIIELLG